MFPSAVEEKMYLNCSKLPKLISHKSNIVTEANFPERLGEAAIVMEAG
jgi:hypothetical protein